MTMKEYALDYARQGIKVFPVHTPKEGKCSCRHDDCDNIGKHPRTAAGFSEATCDCIQVANWWDMWPDANIGAETDKFVVIDCDSVEAFIHADDKGLPNTWQVERDDHRHFYYKQPDPPIPRLTGKNAIFPKLDILGIGGYVILPPSLHVSGSRYHGIERFNPDNLNDCPEWIIKDVSEKKTHINSAKSSISDDPTEKVIKGSRNTALTSLAGSMRNQGADYETIFAALSIYNQKRCVPPLTDREVSTIARSISGYETPDTAAFTADIFSTEETGEEIKPDGLLMPVITHGTASDGLHRILKDRIVFDKTNKGGQGDFFIKKKNASYWEPCESLRDKSRKVLERLAARELSAYSKKAGLSKEEREAINSNYGKAIQKIRTADFLSSSILLFAEKAIVPKISWNLTPGCLPTLDKVLDFSGKTIIARDAHEGEFFRNPVPCTAQEIIDAQKSERFDAFMKNLFYDPDTRETALQCLSLCLSGVPSKTAQIWHNSGGDGGKNSLFDLLGFLVPGRIVMIKSSVITAKGDQSERRFGEAECEGRGGIFFDELSNEIDINQIKKLTGLSEITAERKGRDPFTFRQTWALAMLCNRLPKFRPAEDSAFISRLLVLPFSSVFYANEDIKALKIKTGVPEEKLKPAEDKTKLIESLLMERPGIVKGLIEAWIRCRDNHGGIPYKSKECREAAERYRIENDEVERFFDECFTRSDPGLYVSYDDIKTLWMDFSGRSHFDGMRWLVKEMCEKHSFLEKGNTGGIRVIKGMEKKTDQMPKTEADKMQAEVNGYKGYDVDAEKPY